MKIHLTLPPIRRKCRLFPNTVYNNHTVGGSIKNHVSFRLAPRCESNCQNNLVFSPVT